MTTLALRLHDGFAGFYPRVTSARGHLRTTGIYGILHLESGLIYVGSTTSLKFRFHQHRARLRSNVHDNGYLQNAWNKYGESAFTFVLLERCERAELLKKEEEWMNRSRCFERKHGFNIDRIATHKMHSEETKKKISLGNMGKKHSAETKARISRSKLGKKHPARKTPEQRAVYSRAMMGHHVSEETKASLRAAWVRRKARQSCQ